MLAKIKKNTNKQIFVIVFGFFCMIVNASRCRDVCSRIALACFDAIAQCFIQFQQMIPKCRINPFRESQKKRWDQSGVSHALPVNYTAKIALAKVAALDSD